MSLDISRRIRDALDGDSPVTDLSDVLDAIDIFVQKQQESPDLAVVDQLQTDWETLCKELVDHSSPEKVEVFVSILHAFIPLSQPVYIITCWWDLVLRVALRDPRLSAKALQNVKAITLHGLIPDSPKAPEFRERIIQLFLLDVHDEISRGDALEHATMSIDEKRIQHLWKNNLGDILDEFYVQRSEEFLAAIDAFFRSPQWRLKLSVLLGRVVRSPTFRAKEFALHPLLDSLLLSLVVDKSSTLLEIEMTTLASLLPQFAVHAPDVFPRILPYCFAILARVICWKPRSEPSESWKTERDISITSKSPKSDPGSATQTSRLRPDLVWQRLDATFTSSVSDPPSPLTLFRTIYGLFPCNTLAFLKDPLVYIRNTALQSPFATDWSDIIDEDQIRTRSRALLRQNILHSSLLTHTAQSELAQNDRWAGWDVPRVVMMCTMLDVQNTALSLGRPPDVLQPSDAVREIHDEGDSPLSSTSTHSVTTQSDKRVGIEFQSTLFSENERPRVSVQDILGTYHILKYRVDIDVVDPSPEWPHMLARPPTSPSSSGADATPYVPFTKRPEVAIPTHVEEAISGLQRENLLLRTELNYELWLKRENVKRIGRLYEDRILVRGAEIERQGLHNKLREYKGQVQRLQDALAKEQTGAAATKVQHADYAARLQTRLRNEKGEKQKWANERLELKSAYEDVKAMLDAQAQRLADATENVFKLETEIKQSAPKVKRLGDYEAKIAQFTKTQQLWDDDVRRYKEQVVYIEDLRNRFRKKLLLIESYEKTNQDLEGIIHTLKDRISTLESQIALSARSQEHSSHSPVVYKMMDALRDQVSKLTVERDTLLNENDELGNRVEELLGKVETLQGQSHSVASREVATAGGQRGGDTLELESPFA